MNESLSAQPKPLTTASIMRCVLLALVPGAIAMTYWFGTGVLLNILIAGFTAMLVELVVMVLRKRPMIVALQDCSALLAGVLLALALPPLLPWWITMFGAAVAMLLGKHLFGGLGNNPFNPAMVAYAVLLVSFPVEMTAWISPQAITTADWHAVTMATPLDRIKSALITHPQQSPFEQLDLIGFWAAKGWEWINLAFLLGGLWLLKKNIIDWRIPVFFLGSLFLLSSLDYLISTHGTPPVFALFSGATMLGAFFIATDPVSAATSSLGRILFGTGVGLLVFVIRKWGGYPEGIAFAILLMNVAAPTIDYYCRPRAFGE